MRCFSLPDLPTLCVTRAISSARRAHTVAVSLKASAILPFTPVRSRGNRTEKSPSLSASMAERRARENGSESVAAPGGAPLPDAEGMTGEGARESMSLLIAVDDAGLIKRHSDTQGRIQRGQEQPLKLIC